MPRDPIFHHRISEILMARETKPNIEDLVDFMRVKRPESLP